MANKIKSGWKTLLAVAAAGAFGFFAVMALAQTTGGVSGSSAGGLSGGTSGGGTGGNASGGAVDNSHSSRGGIGLGISIDLTKLVSPDSHETRPANDWQNLRLLPAPKEGEHGLVIFDPDPDPLYPRGVQVMLDDRGHTLDGGEIVPPEGPMVQLRPEPSAAAAGGVCPEKTPCPEAAELERLKASDAGLQQQIDDLKKQNAALKSAVAAKLVCEESEKKCKEQLAAAQSQIAILQGQLSAAQAKLGQPGDGAKSIYVPFAITYDNNKEIVHFGWDIIRAVFNGNELTVENHTEDWIAQHPELPPDQIAWLRANYGGIPGGKLDFGNTLFDGETLRDRVEHLCEPPPSIEELKAKKSVAHILGVLYDAKTQKVTAKSNGKDVAVSQSSVTEKTFTLDLTAECLWTYDEKTGIVKKKVTMQLSVQYQDKDGKIHEVKYEADDPQMGWIMKG